MTIDRENAPVGLTRAQGGSGGLTHHRLRAMAAAVGVDRNLAETFRALFGGRIGGHLSLARPRDQRINWSHNKEVNRRRDQ